MSRGNARNERDDEREQEQFGNTLTSQRGSGGTNNSENDRTHSPEIRKKTAKQSFLSFPHDREQPSVPGRSRKVVRVRDRSYQISNAERVLMTELGRFRTVSLSDLAQYRYADDRGKLRQDVASLKAQKLVRQHRLMAGKGREKSSFLVLTKAGKRVLEQLRLQPSQQAFYAGLVKPQEAAHDAAIYRMYQAEATQIAKRGGAIRRVVLDYELKKKVYSPLAKARVALPPLEFAKCQAEVARSNGLKVIGGKIPLPDLRIEYETREGDLAKIDLELATEHYHGAHTATKAKAGFKIYADSASASRLNAALTYGRSAACEGPELTAVILSL